MLVSPRSKQPELRAVGVIRQLRNAAMLGFPLARALAWMQIDLLVGPLFDRW
jgi:hypothetical protein